jgi:hypothetical protein
MLSRAELLHNLDAVKLAEQRTTLANALVAMDAGQAANTASIASA